MGGQRLIKQDPETLTDLEQVSRFYIDSDY